MGGRLGGWGAKTDEGEEQESFMAGVTDMVRSHVLVDVQSASGPELMTVLGTWKHGAVFAFS